MARFFPSNDLERPECGSNCMSHPGIKCSIMVDLVKRNLHNTHTHIVSCEHCRVEQCRVVSASAQGSPRGAEGAGGSTRAQAAEVVGASAHGRVVGASAQGGPRGAEVASGIARAQATAGVVGAARNEE